MISPRIYNSWNTNLPNSIIYPYLRFVNKSMGFVFATSSQLSSSLDLIFAVLTRLGQRSKIHISLKCCLRKSRNRTSDHPPQDRKDLALEDASKTESKVVCEQISGIRCPRRPWEDGESTSGLLLCSDFAIGCTAARSRWRFPSYCEALVRLYMVVPVLILSLLDVIELLYESNAFL